MVRTGRPRTPCPSPQAQDGEISRPDLVREAGPKQGHAVLTCPGMAPGGNWQQGIGRSAIVSIMEIAQ